MKRAKWTWVYTTELALLGATVFPGGYGSKRGQLAASAAASAAAEQGEGQGAVMHDDIKLNFDEAQSSCEDLLKDNVSDYPLSKYIDTVADENNKTAMLIWSLDNAITEEDGVRYVSELIRASNDVYAEQDSSIAASLEESYGGFYQEYAANIQVFHETDTLKPDKYLVSMTIPAGSNQIIVPLSQYDGANEVILTDGGAKVLGGKYTGDRTGLYSGE